MRFGTLSLIDATSDSQVVSSLSHNSNNQRVWGYLVSGNYFDALGVVPRLGRAFREDEDKVPGRDPASRPPGSSAAAASAGAARPRWTYARWPPGGSTRSTSAA